MNKEFAKLEKVALATPVAIVHPIQQLVKMAGASPKLKLRERFAMQSLNVFHPFNVLMENVKELSEVDVHPIMIVLRLLFVMLWKDHVF